MINATVRLLSGFCKHPDHGINEMASTLPRQAFGGQLAPLAPPLVSIFNDVDDKSVAKDLTAPSLPAVILWGDSSAEVKMRGYKIARNIVVIIALVATESEDDLVMNGASGYILRGGLLTLGRYNNQDKSAGYRELDGVRVLEISSVEEQRATVAVGVQKMWGWLKADVTVVETFS